MIRKALAALLLALLMLLTGAALAEEAGVASEPCEKAMPEIFMPCNPTTGYNWQAVSSDETVLLLSCSYVAEETDGMVAGAGGTFSCKMEGVAPGTATATFVYCRSWESDASDTTLVYDIVVDENLNVIVCKMMLNPEK